MLLGEDELISASTERAARALLYTAAPFLLIRVAEINIESLEVLGVLIPEQKLALIVYGVMLMEIFLLLSAWICDYVSYTRWFGTSGMGYYFESDIPIPSGIRNQIASIERDLERWESAKSDVNDAIEEFLENSKNINIATKLDAIVRSLRSLDNSVKNLAGPIARLSSHYEESSRNLKTLGTQPYFRCL